MEVVGQGGQGEVLRALDHQHDRQVAIKVRRFGSEYERRELLAEARVLLALRPHPGLPLVREDFFEGDRYYLVMEWVDGINLARFLEERGDPGLPVSTVLDYLRQIAEALDHLHSHAPPIIHRDVKPANLILTSQERVVLVDFGIAAEQGAGPASRAGTRGYIAPEIARGDPPTPAADIYSLGATAFALLTGMPPEGVRPEWEGLAPRDVGPVERAVRRALSIDPARRPGKATELIAQLRARLEGSLPTGIVTLLLTEVEGSTRLWDRHPEQMGKAVARHDEILADLVERHGGRLGKTRGEGDGAFAVFSRPHDAVVCALAGQQALFAAPWPDGVDLRVRMALHTGEVELRGEDYFGLVVNRCARLRAIGHGGQTLLSQPTAQLVQNRLPAGASLRPLGLHRLKDLARPEEVFQLCHPELPEEFPPLRSLEALRHNLPVQLTAFIGREKEIAEITELLTGTRLLTLTGAGGCGKTRLAMQVGADLIEEYPDGVWLVELAALSDPALVTQIGRAHV